MRNFKYRFLNHGNFKGYTEEFSFKEVREAFKEVERICNVAFEQTNRSANIYIEFRYKIGEYNSLGRFESPNRIVLSSGRPMDLARRPRLGRGLLQHELLHYFRYYGGGDSAGHSVDRRCISNAGQSSDHFCPAEVKFLQNKYGRVDNYWPLKLSLIGNNLRKEQAVRNQLITTRAKLIFQRNNDPVVITRKATHALILALNPKIHNSNVEIKKISGAWHVEHTRWKSAGLL